MPARGLHRFALDHVSHGAVRRGLGQQHGLGRIEQLGALAHKLHAAQHNGLLRQADGELGQVKRVAHVICRSLDLRRHVIVRQDHGVAILLKPGDALKQILRIGVLSEIAIQLSIHYCLPLFDAPARTRSQSLGKVWHQTIHLTRQV